MENTDGNRQSSSLDMDTDVTPTSSTGPDVETPQSSSGEEPVSERDGLLSAVKDVVAPEEPEDAEPQGETPPETGEGEEGSQPEAEAEGDADAEKEPPEVTEEELKAYTPNARKRIEGLVRERNDLRKTVETLEADAGHFRNFQNYLQENALQNEEVNQLLQIGATLKRGDLKAFHQMIAPYYRIAAEAAGEVLPADLRQQVDRGDITEEAARQYAQERGQITQLQAQLAQRDYASQQQQTRQVEVAREAIRSHVSAWETQIRQSDPDYSLKADLVQAYARGIVQQRGQPTSAEQALAWTKEAYQQATEKLKSLRPAPQPTRPAPGGINTPTAATPEPRSLEEAIKQGLQRSAG